MIAASMLRTKACKSQPMEERIATWHVKTTANTGHEYAAAAKRARK